MAVVTLGEFDYDREGRGVLARGASSILRFYRDSTRQTPIALRAILEHESHKDEVTQKLLR